MILRALVDGISEEPVREAAIACLAWTFVEPGLGRPADELHAFLARGGASAWEREALSVVARQEADWGRWEDGVRVERYLVGADPTAADLPPHLARIGALYRSPLGQDPWSGHLADRALVEGTAPVACVPGRLLAQTGRRLCDLGREPGGGSGRPLPGDGLHHLPVDRLAVRRPGPPGVDPAPRRRPVPPTPSSETVPGRAEPATSPVLARARRAREPPGPLHGPGDRPGRRGPSGSRPLDLRRGPADHPGCRRGRGFAYRPGVLQLQGETEAGRAGLVEALRLDPVDEPAHTWLLAPGGGRWCR